jgi:hypothetical protein
MQGKAAAHSKSQEPNGMARYRKPTLKENIILGQSSEENYSINDFEKGSMENTGNKANPF